LWCLPGKPAATFVAAMEQVLRVYERPRDDAYPVVCFDEGRKEFRG
jgi:hypothetical protein